MIKDSWSIKIVRVDNGYKLIRVEEAEDSGESSVEHEMVIEDTYKYNHKVLNELSTFKRVLFELINFFGVFGSKHSYKLHIDIMDCKEDKIVEEDY
jgi:hypothetical protein